MPTGGRFVAARIDRALADRAAQLGPRILVVAALDSTLGPTAALIRESAAALQVPVVLEMQVVDSTWAHFISGHHDAYQHAIVNAVRAGVGTASVVVLAQASMAPAGKVLGDLGILVLSSSGLGVQRLLRQLEG